MYDAMGVRRQAGYHATAINNLVTAFPSEANLGRRNGESTLEAGLVGGGYQSGSGEADNGIDDSNQNQTDALLGSANDVAESFQQGFQDFLTALQERPLREHIGHTPVQVLAGGVLGVVVGTAYALALKATESGTTMV
jgi:hypothetical protein|tara:strand:+ start:13562 stop:13975 length:414 start_codon:yes stop_codon:yes gene_type:complete